MRRQRGRTPCACLVLVGAFNCLLFLCPMISVGQNSKKAEGIYFQPSQIPFLLRYQYLALGSRLQKPGNERIAINGVLTDSMGSQPVQVIMELGGKVRIDTSAKSLRFDGQNSYYAATNFDKDLLESLVDDLPETFITAAALGSGFHLLGQRFSDQKGGFGDIYDTLIPGKTNKTHPRLPKRCCFDSLTGLLSWVQYRSGMKADSAIIETRFSDWIIVNGQAVPTLISRSQGGQCIFTLEAQEVNVLTAAADNLFAD